MVFRSELDGTFPLSTKGREKRRPYHVKSLKKQMQTCIELVSFGMNYVWIHSKRKVKF